MIGNIIFIGELYKKHMLTDRIMHECIFKRLVGSMVDGKPPPDQDLEGLCELMKTIGAVLDFAEKDGNTLVIVTADHETGGFTLSAGENYDEITPTFSNGGHSTALIPVAAYGPGSELFRGVYENTEIFHKMMRALTISKSN